MQTEMGGRYFPTLTTSRSTNRNITQVLLVLTEGHCANTQGEDEMPGLKCKRVKPHFVQRGERCQVVSLTLQDLCQVWFTTTQCATTSPSPHLQTPHFVDGRCQML